MFFKRNMFIRNLILDKIMLYVRSKMWLKIKKLNLLVFSLVRQSATSSRNKRKILITILVMRYDKGVARIFSSALRPRPYALLLDSTYSSPISVPLLLFAHFLMD